MRAFIGIVALLALLTGGMAAGWWAMNYYAPGTAGTPAHAGMVSNGKPEECTNMALRVKARAQTTHTVLLGKSDLVRGTFEVQGGLGRVDIFLRVESPQGLDILASPKAENYDFNFATDMDGEYTFVFDNRYSMFTSKSVGLFYCVEPQP